MTGNSINAKSVRELSTEALDGGWWLPPLPARLHPNQKRSGWTEWSERSAQMFQQILQQLTRAAKIMDVVTVGAGPSQMATLQSVGRPSASVN